MSMTCEPIGKPVRERSRAHLAYVGQRPRCCIPGCLGAPIQVHHLTHVQPKARGLKAGDQWTVNLCLGHHLGPRGVHAAGNEARWWREIGVDGVAVAVRLWSESQALKPRTKQAA